MHKKLIVACLKKGGRQEVREFGTMTGEIKKLTKWLKEAGCEMAAMESTGVYWKPLYNLFELMGLDMMVVNAVHMKAVPGRKTDIKDAEWIAELLRHGLLKASFIPSREQRELRELTRYRKSLTEECSRELSRLQKVLEGANVKLASVVGTFRARAPGGCWTGWRQGRRLAGRTYCRFSIRPCSPSWMISPRRWRALPHRFSGRCCGRF